MGLTLDRNTLDRLLRNHLSAALRLAIRLTGDEHEAEEIVQDALVRVARSWRSFRGDCRFQTWLIGIIINVFRDRLTRERLGKELPEEMIDRRCVDPAAAASASELGQLVAKAVSTLPPRQREVVVLTTYEGLSTSEAALALGTTEQNVRTNLHFARQHLRQKLASTLAEKARER